MNKKNPTYDLETIQQSSTDGKLKFTGSARKCMFGLDLCLEDVEEVVAALRRRHFHKSMTTYADHTTWQDVYLTSYLGYQLYVKFQVDEDGYLLVSFKENENV